MSSEHAHSPAAIAPGSISAKLEQQFSMQELLEVSLPAAHRVVGFRVTG